MHGVGAEIPIKRRGTALFCLFFSQYFCADLAGTNVLAHDVSIVPGNRVPVFGFCFPPPIMAGHILQHLAESRAHAVALLAGVKAY